ncbi:MAG: glutamate racemase [Elusimicrobiaceae bacterium]|nr:glutamate racemase [Elusimicrobiaceae bacterium]
MRQRPIGIFDSGLGGLTVLKAVQRLLPNENIIYYGDTAHVPYGSKSKKTVTDYSLAIADFLTGRHIKLLVIACNTASASAADILKKHLSIPVTGVIVPGAQAACRASGTGRIAVIGTEATIRSGAYDKAIRKISKTARVFNKACPLLVPLVEEGWWNDDITDLTARKYLEPLRGCGADTLILGCTHYPVIRPVIQRAIGGGVTLVDSAEATAAAVRDMLRAQSLLRRSSGGRTAFYASDDPVRFARLAKNILGRPVAKVNLKKLAN